MAITWQHHLNTKTDVTLVTTLAVINIVTCSFAIILSLFVFVLLWRRLVRDGLKGSLFMLITLVISAAIFLGENLWNQECLHWIWSGERSSKQDCMEWKQGRNLMNALTEAFQVLFFWFRAMTFYADPIQRSVVDIDDKHAMIFNFGCLVLTLLYPAIYTVYTFSDFWFIHHTDSYMVHNKLCYLNYTRPLSNGIHFNPDKTNMAVNSSLQFYQLLLHILAVLIFLLPFIKIHGTVSSDLSKSLAKLFRRMTIITANIFLVNLLTWILAKLCAPYLHISKFLLDGIGDVRVEVTMVLAVVSLPDLSRWLCLFRGGGGGANGNSGGMGCTSSTVPCSR